MKRGRLEAILLNKPVFLSFSGTHQVAVLVRALPTDGVIQYSPMTFCCMASDRLPQENAENKLANSTIADILMSEVRDEVVFYVETDEAGKPTSNVVGFRNVTKNFGSNYGSHF